MPISLNNSYVCFNKSISTIYVCTNGYVSFDSYTAYEVKSFSSLNLPIIAGLSMDLDTSNSGNIYYRETTSASILASLKSNIVAYGSSKYSSFDLNSAFIVTYDSVPFYGEPNTNHTFQIAITTTTRCETFAIVTYKNIYSGKTNYLAGFSAQSGVLYKQIAFSDMLALANNSSFNLPSFTVYKISTVNSALTCSKKFMKFCFLL